MRYQQVVPNAELMPYIGPRPFAAILVIEAPVDAEWQRRMSKWLVGSRCLYMMAWGLECSGWDDSVDYANLQAFDYGAIPDDKHVMTTWHENETIQDVFNFAKHNASPMSEDVQIMETVVFHIGNADREAEYQRLFAVA
jgi:hypothetical protein